ncbi:hypothetical protein BDW74DRAFT_91928 [Aspergillus multicolor]|uniref:uncharacterized protein n=1 Tax=Aspergillus multicolor TaxID=41759 RepID=UPI003CCDF0AB
MVVAMTLLVWANDRSALGSTDGMMSDMWLDYDMSQDSFLESIFLPAGSWWRDPASHEQFTSHIYICVYRSHHDNDYLLFQKGSIIYFDETQKRL